MQQCRPPCTPSLASAASRLMQNCSGFGCSDARAASSKACGSRTKPIPKGHRHGGSKTFRRSKVNRGRRVRRHHQAAGRSLVSEKGSEGSEGVCFGRQPTKWQKNVEREWIDAGVWGFWRGLFTHARKRCRGVHLFEEWLKQTPSDPPRPPWHLCADLCATRCLPTIWQAKQEER